MLLSVDPPGLGAFAAANTDAAKVISAAGAADSVANLSPVAAAVGPIGAGFTARFVEQGIAGVGQTRLASAPLCDARSSAWHWIFSSKQYDGA